MPVAEMPAQRPGGLERAVPSAARIPPNCLHAVFRSVDEWQRLTGREVIKLHVGEPAFAPPPEVAEALAEATRSGRTAYTSAEGMPELRAALSAKLSERNGVHTTPERVFVSPGSCQGLAALLQSIAYDGGEVLLPELHWPIHLQQRLLAGLRPRFYPLDERYRPHVCGISAAATPRTCALLVNSPANPTGAVLGVELVTALLELAHSRGWWVISDEAYEDFVYEGRHIAMAALESDLPERQRRVFATYSFSKSFAMTGNRLG